MGADLDHWTQGIPRPRAGHPITWQELLFRRITGAHGTLPQGRNTIEAEHGLDLDECAYFYIGRCDPAFSQHAAIFHRPECETAEVTPFDTGGFWFDHVTTEPPTDPSLKPAFVSTMTMPAAGYYPSFRDWGSTAFSSEGGYIDGVTVPLTLFAVQIDLSASALDARCWTWEGRVSKSDNTGSIVPRRLFMQDVHYRQYTTWVRNNTRLATDERIAHIDQVAQLRVDAGVVSGGDAANQWLNENGSW